MSQLALPQYVRVGDGLEVNGQWWLVVGKDHRPWALDVWRFRLTDATGAADWTIERRPEAPVLMHEGGLP